MPTRRTLLAAALLPALAPPARAQPRAIRIAQATSAISFLPIAAARAFDLFHAEELELAWAGLSGDQACLAALAAGGADFAAVSSESVLKAASEGQGLQMTFALMSKVTLQLVAGNGLIERTGVSPEDDAINRRLAVLDGATVGVTALGGGQERAVRWLATQAKLNPDTGVKIVLADSAPAAQAMLADGKIDAFVLSPPQGLLSEDARTGRVLIRIGDEFPQLEGMPWLALVAKTPVSPAHADLLTPAIKALRAGAGKVLADPSAAARRIQAALYPKIKPQVMQSAIVSLKSGIESQGRFDPAGIAGLLNFARPAARGIDPAEGVLWTNAYWTQAAK